MVATNNSTTDNRFRIIYRDSTGEVTERVIDVGRTYRHHSTGNILIVAFCWRRKETRTFNAANILDIMPESSVRLPATFGQEERQAVAAAWLPILSNPNVACWAVA